VAEPADGCSTLTTALFPTDGASAADWLAARDTRLRLLAAGLFALMTLSLTQFWTLLTAGLIALTLASAAGLTLRMLRGRLLALEGFMLFLLLTLPFTVPGEPLLTLGPLTASRAGVAQALLILLKANVIVITLLALAGSLEPVVFGHALARLGLPEKLVHLLLFTVRQIHLLHQEYQRMDQAMRVRAFRPRSDRHTWNSYGWLIGMLLVRSLARARRIMGAMRCRGFHGRLYLLDTPTWNRGDTWSAAALGVMVTALTTADRLC
jgi:cobalt/nickel transport system permease protein